jgi:hypothetical protein
VSERERRRGLEGVPITDVEVWGFDAARGTSDLAGLALAWVLGVGTAGLAIWGGSPILGVFSFVVLVLALAVRRTVTKWRSWSEARRMMRRDAGGDDSWSA